MNEESCSECGKQYVKLTNYEIFVWVEELQTTWISRKNLCEECISNMMPPNKYMKIITPSFSIVIQKV